MRKVILLVISHGLVAFLGFAAGIYVLPILIAPPAPSETQVRNSAESASFKGEFRRDLADSDALHYGEGTVYVSRDAITLDGEIAPGPDYKLYLSPSFVETEAEFEALKANVVRVGDVKTFQNFIVAVPPTIDSSEYDTVVVWCESFSQFITAAKYR